METINLPVPFVSQEDPQANENPADNCGPATISMILTYLGLKVSPNDIFEKTGAVKGELITIDKLRAAISFYGFTSELRVGCTVNDLAQLLSEGIAPIALVHYENLTSREDQ